MTIPRPLRTAGFVKAAIFVLGIAFALPLAGAQQQAPPGQVAVPGVPAALAQPPAKPAPPVEKPPTITRHTVVIGGAAVPYTATVGEMIVNKADETPGASVFYVAYTRDDTRDRSRRPITFAYNGGPGSSSVWLHLGALGPRRIVMDDEGRVSAAPYGLADNPNSILDVTDLVMIDPVSTGFSRPLPGEPKTQFHGVQEDVASVGEFIRLYVTRNARWESPKFLLGESYGTTRSAALSGYLQGRSMGMYLNGIVLVSSVLDFSTIVFSPGDDVPYVLYFPHYTATAWYHKRLPADLQAKPLREVLNEAETFAANEYSGALFQGNRLSAERRDAVARRMAALTGLDAGYLQRANLRVRHDRFVKELRRSDSLTVGRLDSRFTGRDEDAVGEGTDADPSSSAIMGAFSTRINQYLRVELGYSKDSPYAIYGNVYPWNFSSQLMTGVPLSRGGMGSGAPDVTGILRDALAENPDLRVMCCNGYYDGATPYFGTEYTFARIGWNGEFKDRVSMAYYEAGHMMYIHKPSLQKFKKDVAAFIEDASRLK